MSIVVNTASLAEYSTSSSSMSRRDQVEELRQIQDELPNMNLDQEKVFAAQQVKISGHQALVFWDDGATWKAGVRGSPTFFIVETIGGNQTEERVSIYEFDMIGTD